MLLTACGGSRLTPAVGDDAALASGLFTDVAAKHCLQRRNAFFFEGSCDTVTLRPQGVTASLADYRGIVATLKLFPRKDVPSGIHLTVFDAIGKGDIKPHDGKRFPFYTKPGVPIAYFKFVNPHTNVDFKRSPYLNITDAATLRGSSCTVAFLTPNGWFQTKYRVPIFDSHVVRFEPLHAQFNLPHGASYLVIACN